MAREFVKSNLGSGEAQLTKGLVFLLFGLTISFCLNCLGRAANDIDE